MNRVQPSLLITCLNNIVETFDEITEKYDVFKVETKADASYMIVAGLNDRLAADKQPERQLEKNLQNFNQTETIGHLALDLLDASKNLINPLKNEAFAVKIGSKSSKERKLFFSLHVKCLFSLRRFSFGLSSWRHSWSQKSPILFIW